MNTWSKIRFGDLFFDGTKNGIYKEAEFHGSGTKVVNMGQVFEYLFISNQEMERYQLTEEELRKYSLIDGDLVFARRSLVDSGAGKAAIVIGVTEPMVFESSIIRVRLDPSKCVPLFYLYWLQSFAGRSAIRALVSGTSVKGIKGSDLPNMLVDYPSIEIQKVIASLLHQYDEKIKNNELINANLLQQSKAIFEQLVVKTNERTELSLTDIANFQNGLAMQKNRPIEDNWLPVLKIKELGQGYCDESSERCRSDLDESVLIHDGDVVFSWSGSLMSKIWCGGDAGLNQHLFKVTSSDYPLWFYYCWLQYHIPNFIDIAANKATTMGHICRNHLEDAIVWKPNEEVMKKVDQTLSPLFDQYIALSIESKKLSCLRDYLLPKLISGEIDVSNLPLPN